MTEPIDKTIRIVYCPTCRRFLDEPSLHREALLATARLHYKLTKHGVWLPNVDVWRDDALHDKRPIGIRQDVRRAYDPARRLD